MIGLAGKQRPGLQLRDVAFRGGELLIQLLQQIVFLLCVGLFLRQMDVRLNVPGDRGEFFIGGNLLFGAFPVAQNRLCRLLIVPEAWIRDACFECFQALAVLRGVKDSSARA
jgi:hypothetical protein